MKKVIFIIVVLFTALSCKKEKEIEKNVPVLTTVEITEITENSAISGGNITSEGGDAITVKGVVWSTHSNPTTADNKTIDGEGTGSFVSNIVGLESETEYYLRAYATNSKGTAYGNTISFQTLSYQLTGTFTDNRDGNIYNTIKIGNQVWMAENLRYLPSVVGPSTSSSTEPYYYVYNYNGTDVNAAKASNYYTIFGTLYNWHAAMNGQNSSSVNPSGVKGICPDGWHLPSDAEWTQLVDYLGGENVAGGKMKENTNLYWISPNTGATNESGFTALPGGYKYTDNNFYHVGYYATWWSATSGFYGIFDRYIMNDSEIIFRTESDKSNGWSVRCIKN